MLNHLYQYLLTAGLSALKVIPGVGLGVGFGLNHLETFLCVFIGGMLGVTFYTFFGIKLREANKRRRKSNPKFAEKTRKNFRKARRFKRLWNMVGIYGVALLTPPILSPPIGTLLAVGFGEHRGRIILFMSISMALWAAGFVFLGKTITGLFS